MKKLIFISKLGKYIEEFIIEKQRCGFSYEFESYILEKFDKFIIINNFNDGILSKQLIEVWATQKKSESINYRNQRVSFVCQFAKYLLSIGIQAYVHPPLKNAPIAVPYILNYDELRLFLKQVDNYSPQGHLYIHQLASYSVIFRLYLCCGLRLNEPLRLKIEDVDLNKGILRIIHSKGNKDRNVFMSDDLSLMCKKYDFLVKTAFPNRCWFFVSVNPEKPLYKTGLDYVFKKLWQKSGCYNHFGKNPTVHSLRHTYVVMRLNKWIEEGYDIQTMMPYLSKQLGHASVDGTQYYYHTVEASASLIREIDNSSNCLINKVNNTSYNKVNDRQVITSFSKCARKRKIIKTSSLIPKVNNHDK